MIGLIHPTRNGYMDRFGGDAPRWFKGLAAAERCLKGIRYETGKDTIDIRHHRKDWLLSVGILVDKWL